MWKWLLIKLGFMMTDEERKDYEVIRKAQERLAKFNGKFHISDRGGMRLVFKTEQDEQNYYKHLHDKFWGKSDE